MILFSIFTFLQRISSAVINKYGYQQNLEATLLATLLVSLINVAMIISVILLTSASNLLCILAMVTIVLISYKKAYSFFTRIYTPLTNDIHFWELVMTSFMLIAFVLWKAELTTTALLFYPGLFLHKAIINSSFRKDWKGIFFFSATDDPTGKTYAIPFLGLKMPRFNQTIRFILAIISLLILALNAVIWKFYFDIFDLYYFFTYICSKIF